MLDPKAKKTALRGISNGAYVVGYRDAAGEVNAFLGTWLIQCSFDPPLVAAAVKVGNPSQEAIHETRVFSVNILDKDQKDLGARFFKPAEKVGNKLADLEFTEGETGCPVLADAVSYFECKVTDVVERGDHWLYVGEVVAAGVHREAEPLTCRDAGWTYGG
jgi:flavin reductase (DIM6/NTAB) family NADH-FMN oxidoreductase RutF